MRAAGVAAWLGYTEGFEGGVPSLYNDIEGKTTIAFGNLCDSPGAVAQLALVHPDGTPATSAEKIAAFHAVHDDPAAAAGGWRYAARLSPLRLTHDGMRDLALAKLASNNRELVALLPDFEALPLCAQFALHSWAWACGAGAKFPKMLAHVRAREFAIYTRQLVNGVEADVLTGGAAVEIFIEEWTTTRDGKRIKNTGLVPRNVANRVLMKNADRVQAYHLDPDYLEWKVDIAASEAVTQPVLENPPSSQEPVLEDDGGASRREATFWAVDELAKRPDPTDE